MLIIRDAMYGVRRFDDFQANLGVARNVLTVRLRRLVEAGIFRRVPYQQRPLRYEYRLTDKGAALFTVIVGLKEWGDRYCNGTAENGRPMELVDRLTGHKVEPALVDSVTGTRLDLTSVHAVAGAGASEATRTFFSRLEYARSHRRGSIRGA